MKGGRRVSMWTFKIFQRFLISSFHFLLTHRCPPPLQISMSSPSSSSLYRTQRTSEENFLVMQDLNSKSFLGCCWYDRPCIETLTQLWWKSKPAILPRYRFLKQWTFLESMSYLKILQYSITTEIMHSDWFNIVMGIGISDQSAIFQHIITTLR